MATKFSIAEQVKTLITPILEEAQVELVDVEYTKEGPAHYLRIFIDKPDGVTLDDCQFVSRESEVLLDVEDIIHTQYILEVSSPGLDRPLKKREDYRRFCDRLVKVHTYQAVHGRKKFLGRLKGLTEGPEPGSWVVTIETEDRQEFDIPYEAISAARLEVEF
jgi:ribosome maturation factor RimP